MYLGRKAGQTFKKSKWMYDTLFGSEEESISSEFNFGKQLANEIISKNQVIESALITNIGSKLKETVNTSHKFTFFVLNAADVNAFTLPGGFIFLTNSIIDFCDNDEAELAFILAHEMAHVMKGHVMDRLFAEYSINAISKFLKGGGLNSNAAKKITGKYLISSYSRDMELEADAFGLKILTCRNYNPKGAAEFFERLKSKKNHESYLPVYFSSHPPVEDRLQQIKAIIAKSS